MSYFYCVSVHNSFIAVIPACPESFRWLCRMIPDAISLQE
jgi:hypothetical protein